MTEQEVTECVAIAQLIIESIIQAPEEYLEMIGMDDYSHSTVEFLPAYFGGVLDIIRGTE